MLELTFTQGSGFGVSTCNLKKVELPLYNEKTTIKRVSIGRGEEILDQKTNESQQIVDLTSFGDNTLSRVHASFLFSPEWQRDIKRQTQSIKNKQKDYPSSVLKKVPSFMRNFGKKYWKQLPDNLLEEVWSYARPRKSCILKDLKSKSGIYQKITCPLPIQSDMTISFVHGQHLSIIRQQFYNGIKQLEKVISDQVISAVQKSKKQIKILGIKAQNVEQLRQLISSKQNNERIKREKLSVWRMSTSYCDYFLLSPSSKSNLSEYYLSNSCDNNTEQFDNIICIGRSKQCAIQIKHPAMSRSHAYLFYQDNRWTINDGVICKSYKKVSNRVNGQTSDRDQANGGAVVFSNPNNKHYRFNLNNHTQSVPSQNGTWLKKKLIQIPVYNESSQDQKFKFQPKIKWKMEKAGYHRTVVNHQNANNGHIDTMHSFYNKNRQTFQIKVGSSIKCNVLLCAHMPWIGVQDILESNQYQEGQEDQVESQGCNFKFQSATGLNSSKRQIEYSLINDQ